MDLDSEFSQMETVERERVTKNKESYDPFAERDYRTTDPNNTHVGGYHVAGTGAEKVVPLVLGGLGVLLGVGIIGGTIYLRTQHGVQIRGLIWLGVVIMVGGFGTIAKGVAS